MNQLDHALPRRSRNVALSRIEKGGVLFCSRTEAYYGLNSVGVEIWERLPGAEEREPASFSDLVTSLQELYTEVDAETLSRDVQELLAQLSQGELVEAGQEAR